VIGLVGGGGGAVEMKKPVKKGNGMNECVIIKLGRHHWGLGFGYSLCKYFSMSLWPTNCFNFARKF
jgi:hypothetical protein